MSTEYEENEPLDDLPPLDLRIIEVVRNAPDLKIRPARLSSELGISVEDANAELCGLLRAVGSTASFSFESVRTSTTREHRKELSKSQESKDVVATAMVFQFPEDFEAKAQSSRKKEDFQKVLMNIFALTVKIVKVLVAFGLIISLTILLIAGICATIALIIAISRGGQGGGRHNQRLTNQVRSMFFTVRQMLWCYAIFGEGLDNGQDPFLRETAHTLALGLNVLMSSPRSIWFWMNARHLRHRHRRRRGWQDRNDNVGSVVNQGTWTQDISEAQASRRTQREAQATTHRGLLSVAVEFLFGSTHSHPGPSQFEKWKLRESVILSLSFLSQSEGVALSKLLPYTDYPPSERALQDGILSSDSLSECLKIVSHFHGIPIASNASQETQMCSNAHFCFPEIINETVSSYADYTFLNGTNEHSSWISFLFIPSGTSEGLSIGSNDIPPYLIEQRHVLTKLTQTQFGQCCILNILNYVGITMLRNAVHTGGVLELKNKSLFLAASALLSILLFYARLFFVIPSIRSLILVLCNIRMEQRNGRRGCFAKQI